MGRIEVITGVMFSGKTGELIRRIERSIIANEEVLIVKPKTDSRTPNHISTHNGRRIGAFVVDKPEDILDLHGLEKVVAIDEAQFFGSSILEVVEELAIRTKVIVAGTDMDFRGKPFGSMGDLMAIADNVIKLNAICIKCGKDNAIFNQRLINDKPAGADSPVVLVGGKDYYEARCRDCFEKPR